ncbi:MAG: multidrug resistance protein [Gammaproteobacteria bacterium]|nr:multidrug resistance protein [Gammaproteobacteria bacterium]
MTAAYQKLSPTEIKIMLITMLISMCSMLGVDIHLPSMPHIMVFMHTNKQHVQQSVSIYLLGMGLSLLFYGPFSDKYGRKPVIIFGLILAALSSFAAMYTTHIEPFLLTRLLQGIGSGACIGLGRTMLADTIQGDRLASMASYFGLIVSLSPLLAPMLGGYIQQAFGWQKNFLVLGLILSAIMLIYVIFCPETNHYKNPQALSLKGLYQSYSHLLTHRHFVGCTLLTGLAMSAVMAYATRLLNPFFIKHLGSRKTLILGLNILTFSGLWILFFILIHLISVPLIMLAVFLTLACQIMIGANATSRAMSPFHDKRGVAGALFGGFQMLTSFVSSALIGSFSYGGIGLLAMVYLILGLLGLGIFYSMVKK